MHHRHSSEGSLRPGENYSSSSSDEGRDPIQYEEIQPTATAPARVDGGVLTRHNTTTMIEDADVRELRRIATSMTQQRRDSAATLPAEESADVLPPTDPALDPSSKAFDLGKWLKHIILEMQKEGFTVKEAGVAYKDLSVSGTGAALQLQSTVRTWLTAPLRIGELLSFRKKAHKPILHRFDGLLNSSELLIVLGRPGSGCSTLLKTMTGELHGLHLGGGTTIHYNGIPQREMIKEFKGEATYNQEVRFI